MGRTMVRGCVVYVVVACVSCDVFCACSCGSSGSCGGGSGMLSSDCDVCLVCGGLIVVLVMRCLQTYFYTIV